MKCDPYRRERRRLRADALLVARKVDREARRRLWRGARKPFSSLSRALRTSGLVSDAPGVGMPFLWFQVFPWHKTPAVIAWGRAICRQERKRSNRRQQRERMTAHQRRMRDVHTLAAQMEAPF